jgi:hypothetical protein
MKKNILLFSEQVSDATDILNTYYSSNEFTPQLVFESDKALVALLGGEIELLVYNVEEYNRAKLESILDLRLIGEEFPILTLANGLEDAAYKQAQGLEKTILMNKPYDEEHLLSISKKMAANQEDVKQRWAERFPTNEEASIQCISANGDKGEKEMVRVKNLSKRGTLLMCQRSDYKLGQIIYIEFILEKKMNRKFFAQIAWQHKNPNDGKMYLGVKFLTKEEVIAEII